MDAFRSVARMIHRGLIGADGAVLPGALTATQLRDYVKTLYAWNPEVVEETDFKGRHRAELDAFLQRYATAPELVNHARTADASATLDRIDAHLRGRPARRARPSLTDAQAAAAAAAQVEAAKLEREAALKEAATALAREADEARRKAEEAARRQAQQDELRGRRHEALEAHRDVREKRDALRAHVEAVLTLDLRRRKVETELAAAAQRVADLTAELLEPPAEAETETSEADARLDACHAALEALQREHDAVTVEIRALPGTGPDVDLRAVVAGLVNETHYLEEERALLADRVSKADAELLAAALFVR